MNVRSTVFVIAALFLAGCGSGEMAQGPAGGEKAEEPGRIDGARIYDYDPSTELGDDIFGDIIADLEHDAPGRCTHGGPVCMEYADGRIVAFHTNTTDHNLDGWSEYAESSDGGRTWKRYNRFQLYQSDDGIDWGSGIIVSGDTRHPDGYSHNCIINRYNDEEPLKLMVEYSIIYDGRDTNEYVFFIEPDPR